MIIHIQRFRLPLMRMDRFARMTGLSKGSGWNPKKYVKGECTCPLSLEMPFWVPRELLKRSNQLYLCPHCGKENRYIGGLDELKELQYTVTKE